MTRQFSIKFKITIITIIIIIFGAKFIYASTYNQMELSLEKSFISSSSDYDYINIDIDDDEKTMHLYGETLLDKNYFSVSIKCYTIDTSGDDNEITYSYTCYDMDNEYISNGLFEKVISFDDINTQPSSSLQEPYKYYLAINILEDEESSPSRSNAVITGLEVVFDENGYPCITVYDKVKNRNDLIIDKGSVDNINPNAFLDKTLSTESSYANGDYVLENSNQINSIKNLSDSLTDGSSNDYDKLINIYEWITEYTYYDYEGNIIKYAEVNPYNLYQQFLNTGGNVDGSCDEFDSNGNPTAKMWTYCNGYASMFTALARAQNIPTRIVSGCAISPPYDIWNDEALTKVDHSWVEAYVNDNWIVIDPTRGTSNLYKDDSYSYSGTARYTFFDMSKDSIAKTHYYIEYANGNYHVSYLKNSNDTNNIENYLNGKNDSGYTRGILINPNYSSTDKSTWCSNDRYKSNINPYGEIKRIEWSGVGLDYEDKLNGNFNLSNAKGLEYLSISSQNISGLNLDGCTSLLSLYCTWNKLPELDLSSSANLSYFNCTNNPLKSIIYIDRNNKEITFSSWSGGYVEGVYNDGKITITSKALPGYYALGLYNSSGVRITSSDTYTFTPTGTKYTTRYGVTSKGYPGYPLKSGKNDGTVRQNCNTAIETRLKTLGYFTLTPDINYTSTTSSAVKAFQYNNGISANGEVNETTWNKLFSTSAKSIYKSSYYSYLKYGSSSSKVYLLEFRLKQLGYFNYTPNTYYGTSTRDAVEKFQCINSLSATGSVGKTTWEKLFATSAKRNIEPTFIGNREYKNSGYDVALAELRLKQLGYFNYTPNSYYGTGTTEGVKAFQIVTGLEASGILNEDTWNALYNSSAKDLYEAKFVSTLKLSDSSKEVYLLEFRMKQLGYFKYTPNNYFGTATRDAVNGFKAAHSYYYDGKVTSTVWNKAFSADAISIYNVPYSYLKYGSYSRKVVIAELRLKNLGYFNYTPDRYFKSSTKNAIKAFQADNGLTITGTLNSSTWKKLF